MKYDTLTLTVNDEVVWTRRIEAPAPPVSVPVPNAPETCRHCGSRNLEWDTARRAQGPVSEGRLKSSEVATLFILGCAECSETLQIVRAEDIAPLLAVRPPAKQPVRWEPDGTPVGDVSDEQLLAVLNDAVAKIEARNGWNVPAFAKPCPIDFSGVARRCDTKAARAFIASLVPHGTEFREDVLSGEYDGTDWFRFITAALNQGQGSMIAVADLSSIDLDRMRKVAEFAVEAALGVRGDIHMDAEMILRLIKGKS
ncbi:hypothetical protein CPT_Sonora_094 [Stenotrophomonas phage Sonora]|nr:hypothetical protein CPT_Sonora_094 [Stenotrophomonas phage Sonora]